MSTRVRIEEYTALGDFVRSSFVKHQPDLLVRYPKLNATFLADFTALLTEIKTLESSLILTEAQKTATTLLYAEADVVNKELTFLASYVKNAGLNNGIVTDLKKALDTSNIEGAVLKMEALHQYILLHSAELEDEGMLATFPAAFAVHKTSIEAKNAVQNDYMNARKTLTDANQSKYKDLYGMIMKIMNAGKLVFYNTVTRDEFSVSKVLGRMRSTGSGGGGTTP